MLILETFYLNSTNPTKVKSCNLIVQMRSNFLDFKQIVNYICEERPKVPSKKNLFSVLFLASEDPLLDGLLLSEEPPKESWQRIGETKRVRGSNEVVNILDQAWEATD